MGKQIWTLSCHQEDTTSTENVMVISAIIGQGLTLIETQSLYVVVHWNGFDWECYFGPYLICHYLNEYETLHHKLSQLKLSQK